jgi:AcrR family transcriptional regulator
MPLVRHDTTHQPSRPDRRVARTERALKEALTGLILEKGYESVTVQEIIDRADVGRSTFYTRFLDKDDLMLAVFRDLDVPAPDASTWRPGDPPFAWTLQLFRHIAGGRRLFRAVVGGGASPIARRETELWIDGLARAELHRLGAHKRLDQRMVDLACRFFVGAFLDVMHWWTEDANEDLDAEGVDAAFRTLVLPGVERLLENRRDRTAPG